ncbi:hypothetical protein M404DRAFT_798773 [Pisolithus tinctorius Marx 270]|uniref:Uncharacterized protein n=1 Tax=Pisolithus tinctorius Marx 270 TaxID=870435 RepID=A0A0C3JRM6_PISTI|nr:hypothetical protein M404DRAFT_798773 [Pisolithus tinctorius Marx 270]
MICGLNRKGLCVPRIPYFLPPPPKKKKKNIRHPDLNLIQIYHARLARAMINTGVMHSLCHGDQATLLERPVIMVLLLHPRPTTWHSRILATTTPKATLATFPSSRVHQLA